ncbi:hypothetical protein ROLI_045780 (plasmid) [Roseobacter fucihabitans]|uniref:O-antigen polymerase n=1 Tax=Roseobacter fucihabitans TaxID=1537242 RepID=A0ABZ2C1T8_9RHOB|nr:hypothetical protein [Roseobacter litoralis]MBC6967605.1 hypothetical protein [Roseobacter litoralis]
MATAALLLWLIVAPMLFAALPAVPALLWGVLLPYLFLPEAYAINLPGLPDINKTSAITIGLMLALALYWNKFTDALTQAPTTLSSRSFRFGLTLCLSLSLLSIVGSVLNNQEALRFGPTLLPALRPWDVISAIAAFALYITPFLFARRYLATPETHRALLRVITIMGLIYTLLMLIEIRLSPQLHAWVYGYYQHSFAQHIRDGFRPMVFLQHGLWVGFFIFTATIAAAALWKAEKKIQWFWAALWLFFILMISRNLGAFAIGVLSLAVFFGLWTRMQVRVVVAVALIILFYPGLRQANFIPIKQITSVAATVSAARAGSLQYRLDNEDALLERAFLKPLTGWGGYKRDRIFNELGQDISISEGRWIQTIGRSGWIGYIGLFGLLTLPILFLPIVRRRKAIPPETLALGLIGMGNLIYMIPNSTLTPVSWLIFGALAGFVQYDVAAQIGGTVFSAKTAPNRNHYTRFPPKAQAAREDNAYSSQGSHNRLAV